MNKDKLFISSAIEERPVKMSDGSTEVMFFRNLPNTVFERYFLQMASKDIDVAARASAYLLACGVCEPDGKDALTVDEVVRIKRPIMQRMLQALFDVNGYGKEAKEKQGNV